MVLVFPDKKPDGSDLPPFVKCRNTDDRDTFFSPSKCPSYGSKGCAAGLFFHGCQKPVTAAATSAPKGNRQVSTDPLPD